MKYRLLTLLLSLFCCAVLWADSQKEITRLEAEKMKYANTKERGRFFSVTDELKKVCKEVGDERLFYKTWCNQAIYEATQQNYSQALGIAEDIMRKAREDGSVYGEYAALHANAMILLQKQEEGAAEKAFLEAVDFWHRHFPNESAGDDLLELMKIAIHRKDTQTSVRYARQIQNEPNVAPMHKGEALYHLSQMAFQKNDVEGFNRIYKEFLLLRKTDGITSLKPDVDVNYCIINGDLEQALSLADSLEFVDCAERKAIIYHRMGDDANAFKYMQLYKQISDSINEAIHSNMVASYFARINDDHGQLEQQRVERERDKLQGQLYLTLGILVFLLLLFFIWRGYRLVRQLRNDNKYLVYEKNDTERALTDLNELSFFESKTELALTTPVNLNQLCNRIANSTQAHCHKGVAVVYQTSISDDFELVSEPEALKKLLMHLLNFSAHFTEKGCIKLSCADSGEHGENVLFNISDTSAGFGKKQETHVVGMFSEQGNKIRYVGMNFNICQSITRLLHGRIWYDAEYTKGIRFCCEIPKTPSEMLATQKLGGGKTKNLIMVV